MKMDFSVRLVYLQEEHCIKVHFLICFFVPLFYRLLEKELGYQYTCEEVLGTLKVMSFAELG